MNGDKEGAHLNSNRLIIWLLVVDATCDHPDIKAVTFVRSTLVAKVVAIRAQGHHKRVLALSGAENHRVAAQYIVNSYSSCAGARCMAPSVLLTIGKRHSLIDKIVELSHEIRHRNGSGRWGL